MGTRLGVQHWAEKGIVTRGVLLDVERYFSPRDVSYEALEKRSISAAQLEDVAREQGVEIRQGDVLCLRFGWTSAYRRLDELGRRALADPEVTEVRMEVTVEHGAGLANRGGLPRRRRDREPRLQQLRHR